MGPLEDSARPDEAARASSAARMPDCAAQPGVQALGPGAVGEILDDAARHAAGDAERIDGAARSSPSVASRRRRRPWHRTRGGMKARLVHAGGRHQAKRQMVSTPAAIPLSAARPSAPCSSAIASTAGTMTAPACTGPPSKVSSKSSPWAAVPLTRAAPAALSVGNGRWPCRARRRHRPASEALT